MLHPLWQYPCANSWKYLIVLLSIHTNYRNCLTNFPYSNHLLFHFFQKWNLTLILLLFVDLIRLFLWILHTYFYFYRNHKSEPMKKAKIALFEVFGRRGFIYMVSCHWNYYLSVYINYFFGHLQNIFLIYYLLSYLTNLSIAMYLKNPMQFNSYHLLHIWSNSLRFCSCSGIYSASRRCLRSHLYFDLFFREVYAHAMI